MHVFNSHSIEDYNNGRAKAKEPLEPIDSKWKFAYYVITCVHFGHAAPEKKQQNRMQPVVFSNTVHSKNPHII